MFCNVETPNPVLGSPPCNEKCAFMLARDRSALAPGGSVVIAAGVERVNAAVGSWRTRKDRIGWHYYQILVYREMVV